MYVLQSGNEKFFPFFFLFFLGASNPPVIFLLAFATPSFSTDFMYGHQDFVEERHRHRYEVNPDLVPQLEEKGMRFVGRDEHNKRMEIMELPDHPFFVGVQYHPEFLSRPLRPSPPFLGKAPSSVF